jgi:ligand-binding SRPBCC domain-containing protein
MRVFEYSFVVNAPLEKVWQFHDDPMALPKVMTGPVKMEVQHVDRPLQPGSTIMMIMRVGPFQTRWNVRLRAKEAMRFFTDEQIEGQGPFKRWVHTHAFEPVPGAPSATKVTDRLEYEPPFGPLGKLGDALFGALVMNAMFASRAKATQRWLEQAATNGDPSLAGAQ